MSEYQIGSEIRYNDRTWRIVRIISSDLSLFEDETGIFTILESYVQLKSAEGDIDHIVLDSTRLADYTGPSSTIKALNPLQWRKS